MMTLTKHECRPFRPHFTKVLRAEIKLGKAAAALLKQGRGFKVGSSIKGGAKSPVGRRYSRACNEYERANKSWQIFFDRDKARKAKART
jgi:hypothetical protein